VAKDKKTKRRTKHLSCTLAPYLENFKDEDRFNSATAYCSALQNRTAATPVRAADRAVAAAEEGADTDAAERAADEGYPAPADASNAAAGTGNAFGDVTTFSFVESGDGAALSPWAARLVGSMAPATRA